MTWLGTETGRDLLQSGRSQQLATVMAKVFCFAGARVEEFGF